MSKRKKAAAAVPPAADVRPDDALWIQRFQILDTCYCFLSSKKAALSLKTVVALAAHLTGSAESLTEAHVRQMASIGVVRLEFHKKDKIILQDDFDPTEQDPNESIELVQFPDVPQGSKRATAKRLLLFQKALQAFSQPTDRIPEYTPPPLTTKRVKTLHDLPPHASDVPHIRILKQAEFYDGQIVHVECIPPRPARFGARQLKDMDVSDVVINAMTIDHLYAHQSEAIDALLQGQHVVISTSTSSGKSMVYTIPVAHSLVTSKACSFFLFPTKALAQDQVQSFRSFLGRVDGLDPLTLCATYDGDTYKPDRAAIRSRARVFFTNPDMLHASIMPQHQSWSAVLSQLKYIVIDEAHMYRGVFGSHVAHILRRLFRLCYMHGSNPQLVCCSASIKNPAEHFHWLVPRLSDPNDGRGGTFLNRDVCVIEPDKDGSPAGCKFFVVWKPKPPAPAKPTEVENVDLTASTIFQSAQILAALVVANVHTIAFCRGRKLTELVLDYTHGILRKQNQRQWIDKVKGYRGGYSAESRRAIEAQLFGRDLVGVVATNALELGIDIGSLECSLHVGYPASIASMWQQAGRAGRSGKDSLAIIVCFDSPLDAFNASLGSTMFHKPPEAVVLDPLNQHILRKHLLHASIELDLLSTRRGTDYIDRVIFSAEMESHVGDLKATGQLIAVGDGYRSPASALVPAVNIRDIADDSFAVVDLLDDNKVIDTIPSHRVFFQVYPTAVYLHQGKEYIITRIDVVEKLALATRSHARLKYYTRPRDFTDVNITTTFIPSLDYSPLVHLGIAHSVTQVVGCYSVEKRSQKVLQRTDLSLPPMESEGHAVWMDIPDDVGHDANGTRAPLHGVNHLLLAVVPHFMLVEPRDLQTEHVGEFEKRARPSRVILYETCKDGIGIAPRLATLFPQLAACAKAILDRCMCVDGCPRCIQSANCSEFNAAISKAGAKAVLDYMVANLPTVNRDDHESAVPQSSPPTNPVDVL
ncbi:Aste57867_9755 [Aphanomyces stellatus]|uniref:Aste57867_9755 protein n=1 Tax=Aphanomyces stellatus TaxID=120398 RepID=A0A485KNP5_9STRA|nr:hypothetical protein As57867_009716 [Aphanomyces stellatus]VFT86634.1 Aste57867_9755 [Aphanomyces stellatus]